MSSPFCLCKANLDQGEFGSRLKFHDLTKPGWICLVENCNFCCTTLDEIMKHGETDFHDPLTNAVFIGEFDFKDAQEIVSNGPYNDYDFVQNMESGEALGIRCLCGRGVLALLVASTLKSPNGIRKDSEKKDSKLPTLSLNSYLKSVRKQLHMGQEANGNGSPSEKKQLIDKCSVCMKVLQLYRSDSDTLATQKLRNHALTHLPKYWLCPQCDQRFQRKNDVLSHMDKKHQQAKDEPLCTVLKSEYDTIVDDMLNQCFPDLQTMPVNRKLIKGSEFSHKELPAGTSIAELNRPSPAISLHNDSNSRSSTSSVKAASVTPLIRPAPTPGELTACAMCSKKLQLAYRGAARHITRMKNHALTHMDAYWMCPVCHTRMHRRSDLANHLGRHDVENEGQLAPVLTIDEDEFQRMVSEAIDMCFPEGGKRQISKEQMDKIPVIEPKHPFMKVRKKPGFGHKSSKHHKVNRPAPSAPPAKESHLYAACDECSRSLKLWKNRRHGIPWTGMANHALTHMSNYWYCSLCKNSYQRRDDAIKHAAKYHKKAKYARCSVPEEKYEKIVRRTVMKCWMSVLKENPGGQQSSNFKGMTISASGQIVIDGAVREVSESDNSADDSQMMNDVSAANGKEFSAFENNEGSFTV